VQTRESSLKFMGGRKGALFSYSSLYHFRQVGRLTLTTWDTGYEIGSVEGWIGIEYFDPSPEVQGHIYAFKCHRQTIDDVDQVWPVNALAFHPVCVWLGEPCPKIYDSVRRLWGSSCEWRQPTTLGDKVSPSITNCHLPVGAFSSSLLLGMVRICATLGPKCVQ